MYRYISIGSDQKVDVYEAKSGPDLFHVNTLEIGIAIILLYTSNLMLLGTCENLMPVRVHSNCTWFFIVCIMLCGAH